MILPVQNAHKQQAIALNWGDLMNKHSKALSAIVLTTCVTFLAQAAVAADLAPAPTKAPVMAAGYDWTGVYLGGHVGGGWQSGSVNDPSAYTNMLGCCFLLNNFNGPTAIPTINGSSFIGGAQIGTMYQIGRLVVGADFDWSTASMNGSGAARFLPGAFAAATSTDTYGLKTNWTASSTATIGLARDRWMLYSKAGVAWENVRYSLGITGTTANFNPNLPFAFASSGTSTVTGWTVGAGGKWAFMDNWFVNVEYDYMDFGTHSASLPGTVTGASVTAAQAAQTFTPSYRQNISEVKAGLNYKFSPGFLFW